MDGVIHRDSHLVDGACAFLLKLKSMNIPYMFLTNNSQLSRSEIALQLTDMGILTKSYEIFTCAMATARFISRQKPHAKVFLIGEHGMTKDLHKNGCRIVDKNPDFVVVGNEDSFYPNLIEKAIDFVARGASLIASSMDTIYCNKEGSLPDYGPIVAMIEHTTGKKAFSVGKPSPVMLRMARKAMMLNTDQIVMVGDTMYTDIFGAVQMGYRSVLVLSGNTNREDLQNYAYQPDLVVPTLNEIPEVFFNPQYIGTLAGRCA